MLNFRQGTKDFKALASMCTIVLYINVQQHFNQTAHCLLIADCCKQIVDTRSYLKCNCTRSSFDVKKSVNRELVALFPYFKHSTEHIYIYFGGCKIGNDRNDSFKNNYHFDSRCIARYVYISLKTNHKPTVKAQ